MRDEEPLYSRRKATDVLAVGSHSIDIDTKVSVIGVRVFGKVYLFPETAVTRFLRPYFERAALERSRESTMALVFLNTLVFTCLERGPVREPEEVIRKLTRRFEDQLWQAIYPSRLPRREN